MKRLPLFLSALAGLAIACAGCSSEKGAQRGPMEPEAQEVKAAEEEPDTEKPEETDPLKLGADDDDDDKKEAGPDKLAPGPAADDKTTKTNKNDVIDERKKKKMKKSGGEGDRQENPEEEMPSD